MRTDKRPIRLSVRSYAPFVRLLREADTGVSENLKGEYNQCAFAVSRLRGTTPFI